MIRILVMLSFVLSGCTTHIAPYRPKKRKFEPGPYAARQAPARGSLYSPDNPGFFEDHLAARLGDTLVIRINEAESASRNASAKLDKSNSDKFGVPSALGIMATLQAAHPNLDPSSLFSSESESSFAGSGKIERKGRLSAVLPVRVRQVLPNGDLFVEGTKVVLVGNEEHHLYVSGIVRPEDIGPDNSVPSSRVADAEIEYTGRGDVSDHQRPGWFSRLLKKIWPF